MSTGNPNGIRSADLTGRWPTYSAAFNGIAPATGMWLSLYPGGTGKVIRVNRVVLQSVATAAGVQDVVLDIASAGAPSGGTLNGTYSGPDWTPHDPTDPVSTTNFNLYSAAPTVSGVTFLGPFRAQKLFSTATPATPTPLIWEFGKGVGKCPTLYTPSHGLWINVVQAALSGQAVSGEIEWSEAPY